MERTYVDQRARLTMRKGNTDGLGQIVLQDLRYLKSRWDHEIDDVSLRQSSALLRRLLVDGDLQRAWKSVGFTREPVIPHPTLAPLFRVIPSEQFLFAAAGGARYRGVEMQTAFEVRGLLSEDEQQRLVSSGLPIETLGLQSFIEGTCMVVRGFPVRRRQLIKFVANKLGGAHFDRQRGNTADDLAYKRLDEVVAERYELAEKSAVYFQLLATGQSVASAPDLELLCTRIEGTEPDSV